MIKALKLQKAVVLLVLGLISMLVSWLMTKNAIRGDKFVLGLSGILLIVGALMLLFPVLAARKMGEDSDVVELRAEIDEDLTENNL